MKTKQELADIMMADLGRPVDVTSIEFYPDPFIDGVYAVRYGPILHLETTRFISGLPVEPLILEGYNDEGCFEFYLVSNREVEQVIFTSWPPQAKF